MILQELQPTTGKLLFNNHSYSQVDSYNNFGIVGQTPIIFEDSLKNNITLGDDTADDQKVITALKQSGLEEFANETSLRMQINENGHNFSGGQLKRIEIARALYFNRQLLLIDEGTASLDPETATSIHESILNNKSLTVIEVDHHIPDEVKKLYDRVYELSNTGLTLQN
jgi:ABC-type transport system involved in cytochrome bd biosynthesis, ATPase and permease components